MTDKVVKIEKDLEKEAARTRKKKRDDDKKKDRPRSVTKRLDELEADMDMVLKKLGV